MSDTPDRPDDADDPFAGLPPELRQMLEQLGLAGPDGPGPELLGMAQQLFGGGNPFAAGGPMAGAFGGGATGPVDWDLARRIALQLADEDDRDPTAHEEQVAEEALRLAEHWLDEGTLPSPPDAGRLEVTGRVGWAQAALDALRPLVEPVAQASADAMAELARQQFDGDALGQLEGLGLGDLGGLLRSLDPGQLLGPVGAMMFGMQAGQVVGALSQQMFGQFDLGVPTAATARAFHVAVNVDEVFAGWELDEQEVAVVLALHEAAHRRLFHAVPWLEGHVRDLVTAFAEGVEVDPERLERMSRDLMAGIDPDDPEAMQQAMERAAEFRLEPTAEQERVLSRLQTVVGLVQAWARREVDRAAAGRLPNRNRIEEVLRRRRAVRGEGDRLLAGLLGLDLAPPDDTVGDAFVAAAEQAGGPEALHRALAHPENLPDADEFAAPRAWLGRLSPDSSIPDDPASLFEGLGDAPVEGTADERIAAERARREHPSGREREGSVDEPPADEPPADGAD